MSPTAVYLTLGISAVADLVGVGAIVWWVGSRKRVAAETIGRAEEQIRLMRQQAEREAESLRKEAQLEARERTHSLVAEAEAKARDRQQEIVTLEQALAYRTRALADRIAGTEKLERELRARDAALAELQKKGMQYDAMPAAEREAMRKATAGVVDDIKKRVGADLVDRVLSEVKKASGS
jgi:ribonuclease Y